MGRPLDVEPTRRDGGDGAEGPARTPAPARAAGAAGRRPDFRPADGGARGGAAGAGSTRNDGAGSGAGGPRILGRDQGTGRRGRARGHRDRGGRRVRCARPGSCSRDAECRSGGGGARDGGGDGEGRFCPVPARRGHRLGQDRGLSGSGSADSEGRSDRPDPDPAAGDRPDPGPDRAHHRSLRGRAGGMAFGRRSTAPASGLGGRDRRALQHCGRSPLGPVPAVCQPAAGGGRRGA